MIRMLSGASRVTAPKGPGVQGRGRARSWGQDPVHRNHHHLSVRSPRSARHPPRRARSRHLFARLPAITDSRPRTGVTIRDIKRSNGTLLTAEQAGTLRPCAAESRRPRPTSKATSPFRAQGPRGSSWVANLASTWFPSRPCLGTKQSLWCEPCRCASSVSREGGRGEALSLCLWACGGGGRGWSRARRSVRPSGKRGCRSVRL